MPAIHVNGKELPPVQIRSTYAFTIQGELTIGSEKYVLLKVSELVDQGVHPSQSMQIFNYQPLVK